MIDDGVKEVNSARSRIESAGKTLSTFLTAPLVAFAGLSVKSFTTFENSMTKSLSVMRGVTGKLKGELEKAALDTDDPVAAARSLEVFARAGFNAQQSVKSLGVATNFAKANGLEFEEATKTLTNAQTILGLRSKNSVVELKNMTHLSDLLTRASLSSGASVEELAKVLSGGRVAGGPQRVLLLVSALREAQRSTGTAGTTFKIMEQRSKTFSEQLQDLRAAVFGLQVEVGRILVPYLRQAVDVVKAGVTWFQGLSKTTKEWVVWIAAAVASLGPLLLFLTGVVVMIKTVAAFVAAAAVGWGLWVAAILAVVGVVVLLTDAILELFGRSSLGLTKWIGEFRVGGKKISTWITAAFLVIEQELVQVSRFWTEVWLDMNEFVAGVADDVKSLWTKTWKFLVEKFLEFQYAIGLINADELKAGFDKAAADFAASVASSTAEAAKRQQEYYAELDKLAKESTERRAALEEAIQRTFAENPTTGAGVPAKTPSPTEVKTKATFALKALGAAAPGITGPAAVMLRGAMQSLANLTGGGPAETGIPGINLPDFEAPKVGKISRDVGKKERQGQDFLVTSLNRFKLGGPGGLGRAVKQQVQAPGIESRLDTLIEQGKKRGYGLVGE
jgi:hypothetical protein